MVKVYTRNNCQACMATKKQLQLKSIEFEEINVEDDPELAWQLVNEGWTGMPVVKTDTTAWQGVNVAEIKKLAII